MHNLVKNPVYAFHNLRPAAEILMQVDFLATAFFFGICLILGDKQLRARQAEAVNTLLDVSDHKNIILPKRFPGHRF